MIPGPARGARSRRRVEQAFEQLLPRCAARPPFACGVSAHRARTSHAPILERAIYFRPCMMAAHVCVPPSRSCAAGWVCRPNSPRGMWQERRAACLWRRSVRRSHEKAAIQLHQAIYSSIRLASTRYHRVRHGVWLHGGCCSGCGRISWPYVAFLRQGHPMAWCRLV